jgi:hypothetical protein
MAVKFLLLTLITHHPDPATGEKTSAADRLRAVVDSAVLAEGPGFDEVIHLSADNDGVTPGQKLRTPELFQAQVAPALRVQIPSRPLAYGKQGAGCR